MKHILNMSGWLNVTHEEGPTFCEAGGCAEHTRWVLYCIYDVKTDFWFANNASVQNLFDTIHVGCNSPQGNNSVLDIFVPWERPKCLLK